jgi:hypothetical protein
MSTPIGNGWQAILADLSLILFMLTASVLQAPASRAPALPKAASSGTSDQSPLLASPVAVYRADAGAPPIADWLRAQSRDHRALLTINVRYQGDGHAAAMAAAAAMANQAALAGKSARVIVEPGPAGPIMATLGYDLPGSR